MRTSRYSFLTVFALCVLGTASFVNTANGAQISYGVDRASNLYIIDYVNGSTTAIGALGVAQTSAFTINQTIGNAFASPGGGWGNAQDTTGCLYGVNLTSGAATQIGCDPDLAGLDPFSDFAFHSDGTMYALRLAFYSVPQDLDMYLCTIDLTTGAVTDIGSVNDWCEGNSLAFVSDVLYRWDSCSGLSTLNLTTAEPSTIGHGEFVGFPITLYYPKIPAMAARQDGTLYGIVTSNSQGPPSGSLYYYLATIDPASGDVTYVATLPSGMQNIAFSGTVADGCPANSDKTEPGLCGCGVAETDSDSDGIPDCVDLCSSDPLKTAPGVCGCGTADTDTDSDSTPDCVDLCPSDPLKTALGVCGCGTADTDTDSDGTPDCNDGCPADSDKTVPGICGCGVADTDSDSDAVLDCNDNCPLVANPEQTDANSNNTGDACESLPDLSVIWSSLRYNTKNMSYSGRTKVTNTGAMNAGTFTVTYYLSTNGTDLGALIGTDTITTGVRFGRSVSSSVRYQASSSLSGQYVIVVVDSGSQVIEKNEGNNKSAGLIP